MAKPPVEILILDSYLATIKNAIGAKIFRNLFARINGKRIDILKNGKLSCAVFTSAILLMFGLVKESHATVAGLVRDLKTSGWRKITKPRPGAILVWDYKSYPDGPHLHCGFYIGHDQAISNSTSKGTPVQHHWTYGQKNGKVGREIKAIYWHPKLKKYL